MFGHTEEALLNRDGKKMLFLFFSLLFLLLYSVYCNALSGSVFPALRLHLFLPVSLVLFSCHELRSWKMFPLQSDSLTHNDLSAHSSLNVLFYWRAKTETKISKLFQGPGISLKKILAPAVTGPLIYSYSVKAVSTLALCLKTYRYTVLAP